MYGRHGRPGNGGRAYLTGDHVDELEVALERVQVELHQAEAAQVELESRR
jgi:hypothetical protein